MYGFFLMAKGQTLEFYSYSKTETKEWIEALKSVVILLDFKEEITIGKLLGKGITSKVHLCQRRSNPYKQYAMKTVHKHFIK